MAWKNGLEKQMEVDVWRMNFCKRGKGTAVICERYTRAGWVFASELSNSWS